MRNGGYICMLKYIRPFYTLLKCYILNLLLCWKEGVGCGGCEGALNWQFINFCTKRPPWKMIFPALMTCSVPNSLGSVHQTCWFKTQILCSMKKSSHDAVQDRRHHCVKICGQPCDWNTKTFSKNIWELIIGFGRFIFGSRRLIYELHGCV